MRPSSTHTKLNAKDISVLALMGALMFAFQVALSGIPNVHITAVLIILTAVFFGGAACIRSRCS